MRAPSAARRPTPRIHAASTSTNAHPLRRFLGLGRRRAAAAARRRALPHGRRCPATFAATQYTHARERRRKPRRRKVAADRKRQLLQEETSPDRLTPPSDGLETRGSRRRRRAATTTAWTAREAVIPAAFQARAQAPALLQFHQHYFSAPAEQLRLINKAAQAVTGSSSWRPRSSVYVRIKGE